MDKNKYELLRSQVKVGAMVALVPYSEACKIRMNPREGIHVVGINEDMRRSWPEGPVKIQEVTNPAKGYFKIPWRSWYYCAAWIKDFGEDSILCVQQMEEE